MCLTGSQAESGAGAKAPRAGASPGAGGQQRGRTAGSFCGRDRGKPGGGAGHGGWRSPEEAGYGPGCQGVSPHRLLGKVEFETLLFHGVNQTFEGVSFAAYWYGMGYLFGARDGNNIEEVLSCRVYHVRLSEIVSPLQNLPRVFCAGATAVILQGFLAWSSRKGQVTRPHTLLKP